MIVNHPNGKHALIVNAGTDLVAEVETEHAAPGWVTIAYAGAAGLIVDHSEWDAFVALIAETNEVVLRARQARSQP